MTYYTLDELADLIQKRREEEGDSYADAGRKVQTRREGADKTVDRSHVHKALNSETKSKYRQLLGELAAVYLSDKRVDTSTAYFLVEER